MEYKFRAWVNGVMIYNVGVLPGNHIWFNDLEIPEGVPEDFYDGLIEGEEGYWKMSGFELMPFILRKDDKGEDIYLEDIISIYIDAIELGFRVTYKEKGEYLKGVVKYAENQCEYRIEFPDNQYDVVSVGLGYGGEKLEVVGNTYQHEELLEAN